ncbi:acetylserotonin O-methyltransferase [Silurus asotus]|uniref:Acetylserotonin O-methyltransferase n=1 Tax=Silurus asotus TaxID=30991 RepID=A0AAD5AWD3_SILAS|nr:acetylserotonin O-methyltransferase [Silurus asotus]
MLVVSLWSNAMLQTSSSSPFPPSANSSPIPTGTCWLTIPTVVGNPGLNRSGLSTMAEHLSQSELNYPFKLLEYFNGFRMSKVIFSACEQGVFDLLMQSQKSLSAAEVAWKLGASEDGMERLLDALVGAEVLEVELNQGTGLFIPAYYSNTDVANLYLAKDSPKSLYDMIIYQSQTIYPLWNNLGDAVREGKNQNEKTFGLSSEDIFSAIYRSEDEMLKFMGLMNSSWVIDGHDVVTAFDLSRFKSIVDVGGCSGALARELSKAYPASTVTVLDLPKVIQTAQKHFCQSDDTIKLQEGDFFKDDLPAADLYVLARIIHDWKEEKSLPLLRKIHAACNSGGGVLLIEAMLFENHRGPIMAQLFSLNMLLQTEGKEHSPSHYTHMLNGTGFSDVQVCRTGKSYDAILALK